jgi:heme/copper-type cytochrome/quinol oxidase subunit 1
MLDERLGRIGFWLSFIGFNVAFGTMHITGLLGMPRRVYTYQDGLGWNTLNLISTVGAFVLAAGFIVFFVDIALALARGEPAGDNPWGAGSLEWATNSPPDQYNWAAIPMVHGRNPLWNTDGPGPPVVLTAADLDTVTDTEHDRRETLGTTMMDAQPDARYILPGPTLWPLFTALAVGVVFISTLISLWIVPIGLVLTLIGVVGWLYPTKEERVRMKERPR